MKPFCLALLLGGMFTPAIAAPVIWFDRPATDPIGEGLPLGNGRLGVLVTGGIEHDRLVVNEDSVWSGWVNRGANNPAAAQALPAIRELLAAGRVSEAQARVNETQLPRTGDEEGWTLWEAYGTYQMLAFLELEFAPVIGPVENYRRELDLATGTAEVSYTIDGVHYEREYFCSHPDRVMVARFTASKPGRIEFEATLRRPDTPAVTWATEERDRGYLLLDGEMPGGGSHPGLHYVARLSASRSGGTLEATTDSIRVRGADAVVLRLTAATDYRGHRAWPDYLGGDPLATSLRALLASEERTFEVLQARQRADHRGLMEGVAIELGNSPRGVTARPTPQRLARLADGAPDPDLLELYFQYGRYLLASSSRPGGLAANLQGLWAAASPNPDTGRLEYATPWNGDYHANINVQMNYWPADVTGLGETFVPLLDLIEGMVAPGSETARIQHGTRGWTLHTLHNPWGYTAPGWEASWGHFPLAGPWIARHLWDHYAYTQDAAYLREGWPALRGSAEFLLDWLVEDPATGQLVSGPSGSPENRFRLPGGELGYFCMAPTMDQMIAYDLFSNVLAAAQVLGEDGALVARVAKARRQLAPPRIGPDGRLLEWAEPYEEPDPGHRHLSHLYGLHPGSQIDPESTPELARAARQTIEYRVAHGGGHTGWSRAWIINFWARLHDGDRASENLHSLLAHSTLPNLFDTHPPFQIDGNLGATAGIAEMLLQSHRSAAGDPADVSEGYLLDLLPALPTAWPTGEVSGLRARGGFTVALEWADGRLTKAQIGSLAGRPLHLRWRAHRLDVHPAIGETVIWRPGQAQPDGR